MWLESQQIWIKYDYYVRLVTVQPSQAISFKRHGVYSSSCNNYAIIFCVESMAVLLISTSTWKRIEMLLPRCLLVTRSSCLPLTWVVPAITKAGHGTSSSLSSHILSFTTPPQPLLTSLMLIWSCSLTRVLVPNSTGSSKQHNIHKYSARGHQCV